MFSFSIYWYFWPGSRWFRPFIPPFFGSFIVQSSSSTQRSFTFRNCCAFSTTQWFFRICSQLGRDDGFSLRSSPMNDASDCEYRLEMGG